MFPSWNWTYNGVSYTAYRSYGQEVCISYVRMLWSKTRRCKRYNTSVNRTKGYNSNTNWRTNKSQMLTSVPQNVYHIFGWNSIETVSWKRCNIYLGNYLPCIGRRLCLFNSFERLSHYTNVMCYWRLPTEGTLGILNVDKSFCNSSDFTTCCDPRIMCLFPFPRTFMTI